MSLSGLRILVTRPAHQADALSRLIEAAGGEVLRLPLMAIEASGDADAQRRQLQQARGFDGWIFTSRNAVSLAAALDPTLDSGPWPTLYAVGGATAAALAEAGHPAALVPAAGSSSEALLALPELQAAQGRRFLIVTGENSREHLPQVLTDRGAMVETLPLYRRVPLSYPAETVEAAVLASDVIVVTSGEALEHLWASMPDGTRALLQAKRLVLPSRRVVEKARELGFSSPLLPDDVSDEAIVRCLQSPPQDRASEQDMSETPRPPKSDPDAPLDPARGPALDPATGPSVDEVLDPVSPASSVAQPPPNASRVWSALAWLLVVLLLGALGYGGWWAWDQRQHQLVILGEQQERLDRLEQQSEDLDSQAAQLATRQSDLSRVAQRNGTDIAGIQTRLEQSDQLLGRLSEELQGGRTRFALAGVEYLLVMANDKLLLDRDAAAALKALEIADQRLSALNDPRYFGIRQSLAEERSALLALPRPDIASAALTLSSLSGRVSDLPLRAAIPPRHQSELPRWTAAGGDTPMQRLWASTRQALSSVFVVRRDDNARALRLLPPEQEAVVYNVLTLKLEAARVALLRGETAAFRESCRSAAAWLDEQFKDEDPGVLAAGGELERLQSLDLRPPLPDISRSLTLLRAQVEAQ